MIDKNVNPVNLVLSVSGLTATQLAERLGIDKSNVSIWRKKGRIPPTWIGRLCEISGLPPCAISPDFPPVSQMRKRHEE